VHTETSVEMRRFAMIIATFVRRGVCRAQHSDDYRDEPKARLIVWPENPSCFGVLPVVIDLQDRVAPTVLQDLPARRHRPLPDSQARRAAAGDRPTAVRYDVPDSPCHGDGRPSTQSRKSDSRRSGAPGFFDSRRRACPSHGRSRPHSHFFGHWTDRSNVRKITAELEPRYGIEP
jgi:hypothetical protein